MKRLQFLLIYVVISNSMLAIAQDGQQEITNKIITSDSIIILSHEKYYINIEPGKPGRHRALLIDGLPNREVVKQQLTLDLPSRAILCGLFKKMKLDSLFEPAYCFNPHHSILFYEKGACSYLDVCFGCLVYQSTRDLKYDKNILQSYEAYEDLKRFFVRKGVNFRIDN